MQYLVALLLLVAVSEEAAGQVADTVAVTATVSGGVSLGSYQAGATFALIHVLRHRDELVAGMQRAAGHVRSAQPEAVPAFKLEVLTGASAGNINALLAGIHYCLDEDAAASGGLETPESTLFWRSWIPIGLEELIDHPDGTEETGVFSRANFEEMWDSIGARLAPSRHPSRPCSLVLGITTTKLTPAQGQLVEGVGYAIQRYAGVFRLVRPDSSGLAFASPRPRDLDSEGLGDVLLLHPSVDSAGSPVLLPTAPDRSYRIGRDEIRALVEASSGFPLAFTPRQVRYRTLDELRGSDALEWPPCKAAIHESLKCEPPHSQHFVDGGVFDNEPMGLALALSDAAAGVDRNFRVEERVRGDLEAALQAIPESCLQTWKDRLPEPPAVDTTDIVVTDSLGQIDPVRTADKKRTRVAQADSAFRVQIAPFVERQAGQGGECGQAADRIREAGLAWQAHLRAQPTRRLLYYIDEGPRRNHEDSPVKVPESEEVGGVVPLISFAGSVFRTGSSTELRLFSQRMRHHTSGPTLGVNTRFAPLMGEHLAHFGAFFARPFRELDFYAGVYDGFRSAFRELYCKTAVPDATAAELNRCEVEWLRLTLTDPALLHLSTPARAVVSRLFSLEEQDLLTDPPQFEDPRALALVQLLHANTRVRNDDEDYCRAFGLLEQPLCTDRLKDIVDDWRGELGGDWRTTMRDAGWTDQSDLDFVSDPVAAYNRAVLRALRQLVVAERRTEEGGGIGLPTLAGSVLFVQRAYAEQYRGYFDVRVRPWFSLNPSTADILGPVPGALGLVLPHSFSALGSGDLWWVTWRPTLYIVNTSWGAGLALALPLEWVVSGTGRYERFRAGPALHFPIAGTLFSGLTAGWSPGIGAWDPTFDLTAHFVANTIRIGWREEAPGYRGGLSIGVGDVNGLGTRGILAAWRVTKSLF